MGPHPESWITFWSSDFDDLMNQREHSVKRRGRGGGEEEAQQQDHGAHAMKS